MNELINFFNHPFFVIVGGISTVVAIVGFGYGILTIIRGVLPVWIRLGKGLSNKKIAVYAESEFDDFKNLLIDSGLFKEKNIEKITKSSLSKGETHTMMLVNFNEFADRIEDILRFKKDSDALIVYVSNGVRVPQNTMDGINNHRNSIVVTFRGRLLNDIVTSLITTAYEKK
ncbi:hypothetical protein [Flavobacterium sp. IB48]|uniref:hypothetical protein n=1 Tax=Flavobacterium sp. IB48 TaxID=2779375 RepID=UPI0018E7C7C6|nr:hypothetical protein [Flavobacterium sp. IB48]MBJ2126305.1 hypothetical protein [Flavobacterium sp. IB48]